MDWKEILKQSLLALVAVIVPILYSMFIGKFPGFPLTLENVLALVVWIVSLMFGGAKVNKATAVYKSYRLKK